MQIGDAARGDAGAMGNTRLQPAGRTAPVPETGRDLDGQAAARVFAAEVLQRIAVAPAARAEHSGIETAHRQAGSTDAAGSVARALRSALAASGARAEDAVSGLLHEVDSGVASAEAALKRMGYPPKQVAAAALQFRERVGELVGSFAAQPPAPVESAQVSAAHVRKERGRIELVTQDGDVVRIGFRVRESERVAVTGVRDGQGAALSARIATEQSARLKVSVQGALDAGELAAIEDFLGKVDSLATQFYDGDAEAAFAAAAALQVDAEELARYSVKLSVRERYDISAQVQAQPASSEHSPAQTAPASTASASVPHPVATKPAEQPVAAPNANAPAAPAAPTATEPAASSGPAAAAGQSTTETPAAANGLDTIRNFVQGMLDVASTPLSVYGSALQWAVKIELTQRLFEEARPDERPRPGADLLVAVMHTAADIAEMEANPEAVYAPVRAEGDGPREAHVTRNL